MFVVTAAAAAAVLCVTYSDKNENNAMHIRGSECDQKILSKQESTGLVYSPNYPYPYLPKTVCRYIHRSCIYYVYIAYYIR